jgi:GT2 family glycosyltransferase
MSRGPFFSIIVPTYNQARYLGAALDSLIFQTDRDWEAVVVNDGSTDETSDVLGMYAQRDKRIRAFHKKNGGVGSALNEGLRHAQGQWICWLSSDDMFDERKLETHREWIERHPDCRFFFTYFRLLREATGEMSDHDLWGPLPPREFQIIGLFYRNYISGISICISREAWREVGFFDESLRYGQDYDMWLRFFLRYPGIFIPEWTCINRNHAAQGSEVFPQACYFDTAKAAIRFLNEHRFGELFPLLDLSETEKAVSALTAALDVAADPSAFLYCFGPHPLLLFRILEWIGGGRFADPACAGNLQHLLAGRASEVVQRFSGSYFGFIWKAVEAACQFPPADFAFTAVAPIQIGMTYYRESRGLTEQHVPLRQYLHCYENTCGENDELDNACRKEVVCLLPPDLPLDKMTESSTLERVVSLARRLTRVGCRVLFLGRSTKRAGCVGDILFLGTGNEEEMRTAGEGLGRVDAAIAVSCPSYLEWMIAEQKLMYNPFDGRNVSEEENILGSIISWNPDESSAVPVGLRSAFLARLKNALPPRMRRYARALMAKAISTSS